MTSFLKRRKKSLVSIKRLVTLKVFLAALVSTRRSSKKIACQSSLSSLFTGWLKNRLDTETFYARSAIKVVIYMIEILV